MPASPHFFPDRDSQLLASAEAHVYRETSGGDPLHLHHFRPAEEPLDHGLSPAILWFFGSGFDSGQLTQFAPQALHFAGRGAHSFLVEYRTAKSHGSTPLDAMQDGRSALAWVRSQADSLGIDPTRMVAAGALAGGTIAAAAAMKSDLPRDESDPKKVDAVPSALVLYSPLLEVLRGRYGSSAFASAGISPKEAHLTGYLTRNLPPMLLLHGTADRETPFEGVERFVRRARRKGNQCQLVPFPGRRHSFFNLNVDPVLFDVCNAEVDRFLVEVGILYPPSDSEVSEEESSAGTT